MSLKPDNSPARTLSVEDISTETGIAVGETIDGMILLFRLSNGVLIWGEKIHPDEAIHVGHMLIDQGNKAKGSSS